MGSIQETQNYEVWFITGSQHLYGEDTLKKVHNNTVSIVNGLKKSLPVNLIFKEVVTTPAEVVNICKEANYNTNCIGVITWCHTFSPSKMWINGLNILDVPWLQLHTQFNEKIPENIDMDFMNLNQAAHGDREHGFIATRMGKPRKVVVGHWQDIDVQKEIEGWMRSAIGAKLSRSLNIVRFGDNMRQVAVTEGDKVEAQIKLGWQVNTHPVGDLLEYVKSVSESSIENLLEEYKLNYIINTDNLGHVRYQAKLQLAIEKFLQDQKATAFTTTFEDLHGLEQLPGLAAQELMKKGYGFGGEGDWKVSAMTYLLKAMAFGLEKGTSFMEDYTYDLTKGNELVLGSHMLEVCPTLADDKPKIEVHPLGIGGKADPARLVFNGKTGAGIVVSLVDMGGRLRLIANDIECVSAPKMPDLPVARVMWKPLPDLKTSATAWMLSGGAHHTVLSYDLNAVHIGDWAEIMGIEFVHISKTTDIQNLKKELFFGDIAYRLRLI